MTGLQEYFPDPHRAAVSDMQDRNLFYRDKLNILVEIASPYESSVTTDQPQRIGLVSVGAVSGGTVTVGVTVDGRSIFDSNNLPVSGEGPLDPNDVFIFEAGSVIRAYISSIAGGAGTATVLIELEPYTLVPRTPQIQPTGAARKRPSTRAAIKQFNATGSLVPAAVTRRIVGRPTPHVLPIGEPLGYRPREVTP